MAITASAGPMVPMASESRPVAARPIRLPTAARMVRIRLARPRSASFGRETAPRRRRRGPAHHGVAEQAAHGHPAVEGPARAEIHEQGSGGAEGDGDGGTGRRPCVSARRLSISTSSPPRSCPASARPLLILDRRPVAFRPEVLVLELAARSVEQGQEQGAGAELTSRRRRCEGDQRGPGSESPARSRGRAAGVPRRRAASVCSRGDVGRRTRRSGR